MNNVKPIKPTKKERANHGEGENSEQSNIMLGFRLYEILREITRNAAMDCNASRSDFGAVFVRTTCAAGGCVHTSNCVWTGEKELKQMDGKFVILGNGEYFTAILI